MKLSQTAVQPAQEGVEEEVIDYSHVARTVDKQF